MTKLIIAILASLTPAAAVAMQQVVADEVRDADGYLQQIEPVAEGIWLIRQPEPFHLQPIGNVTVIEQSNGLVLVDGGGSPESGRRIARLVRSVSPKPVTHVIVTHWHGDHTLGLSGVLESWPNARIIASERTRAALLGSSMERYAKGGPNPEQTAAFLKELEGVSPFLDKALEDPKLAPEERAGFERTKRELTLYRQHVAGLFLPTRIYSYEKSLTLADENAPVELFQPGLANTDGDTAVWLSRQRLLIGGDMVVAPVPFGFGSYPAEWVAALGELKRRNFAVFVPGHGAPQEDSAYIDRLIGLIEDVRSQVAPLAKAGLSLEETRKRVNFDAQKRLFAAEDAWLGRWFDRYWVTPFVEAAWKEAKGIPIEQGKG